MGGVSDVGLGLLDRSWYKNSTLIMLTNVCRRRPRLYRQHTFGVDTNLVRLLSLEYHRGSSGNTSRTVLILTLLLIQSTGSHQIHFPEVSRVETGKGPVTVRSIFPTHDFPFRWCQRRLLVTESLRLSTTKGKSHRW